VDEAKKKSSKKDQIRFAQDSTYQFMRVLAGDLIGYEEALRSLYAKEKDRFLDLIEVWPKDIRSHIKILVEPVFFSGGKSRSK
jgi:hypothetical protein